MTAAVVDSDGLARWEAVLLRLTAFPVPGTVIKNPNWWTEMTGEAPENEVAKPKTGEYMTEGMYAGLKLALRLLPDRIDWLFVPPDEDPANAFEQSSIGPLKDSLDPFLKIVRTWIPSGPPIVRLAFGAVLLQNVEDRRSGYLRIQDYVPAVKLDPENSSDFLYQINRPRASSSGISGLRVNRLMKWSVARFAHFSLQAARPQREITYTQERFACRVELDINTAPDFAAELPKDKTTTVLDELVACGLEIADKGDRP